MKLMGARFNSSKAATDFLPSVLVISGIPQTEMLQTLEALDMKRAQWRSGSEIKNFIRSTEIRVIIWKRPGLGSLRTSQGNGGRESMWGKTSHMLVLVLFISLGMQFGHTKRSDTRLNRLFVWCIKMVFSLICTQVCMYKEKLNETLGVPWEGLLILVDDF